MNLDIKCLSLHIDNTCNLNCPFCYIDKSIHQGLTPSYLEKIPSVCKELGIEQIAIGGGEPFLFDNLRSFIHICNENDIIANITTNGNFIEIKNKNFCVHADLISSSIDNYKLQYISIGQHIENSKLMRALSPRTKIGFNILLDNYTQKNLYSLINKLEPYCDYFYLLQMKNHKSILKKKIVKKILALSVLFGDKVLVDDSIRLSLGYSDRCGRGINMVSLHPDKSIRPCSFSKPIGYANEPEDIISIVKDNYPLEPTRKCMFIKH